MRIKITRRKSTLVKTEHRSTDDRRCSTNELVLCPHCGEPVVNARNCKGMSDLSLREVFRLVEADKIHFYESAERIGFTCLKSLATLTP